MLDLESAIRNRAYDIWQAEGRVHGHDVTHWLRAEAEIKRNAAPAAAERAMSSKAPAKAAKQPAKSAAKKPAKKA